MRQNSLYLGAFYITTAELMFACMGASIRFVSDDLNNPMVVFARNLLGLLFLLPWLLRGGMHSFKTRVPHLHLLRGLAGVSAMYCFFYAIAKMPLADAMLLKLSAPLFMPIVALLWLKEDFTWHVVAALAVGFSGVAVILTPDLAQASLVSLVALAGGAFAAIAKVTVRRLSRSETGPLIVFYFALSGLTISSLPLPWFWQTPTPGQAAWLILMACFATAGQLLLTRGMSCAPAARLGPFTFFSVIFGAALGWFLWDEAITLFTSIGASLILLSAFLTGRGRKQSPPPRTLPADT